MNEIRARLESRLSEYSTSFWVGLERMSAKEMGDAFRHVTQMLSEQIAERHRVAIENDALATELSLYRPTRSQRSAAPKLPDYCYVTSGNSVWVCIAREIRHTSKISGIEQEHYMPDSTTVCGRKTGYPIHERFTSGGWPRRHELCVDCCKKLAEHNIYFLKEITGEQ
jgi:hypothetical protein